MTDPNVIEGRVTSLQELGYTPKQAQFLVMAALLSGYFLRRQYCAHIDRAIGGLAAAMVSKLLAKKHAATLSGLHGVKVYHLSSRPFYAGIGEENNRNRREREPEAIRNRLMILDFAIQHPNSRFLATEQEKVEYFTGQRAIDPALLPVKSFGAPNLPATVRAFPDRYPIYLAEAQQGPAVPVFCFIDEGLVGISRFERYLERYSKLFTALGTYRVEYVSASTHNFDAAKRAFDAFVDERPSKAETRRLDYFRNRLLFEEEGLTAFDRSKLAEFRQQRQAFPGSAIDADFEAWKSLGAIQTHPGTEQFRGCNAQFSTYLLEENYDVFGSLPSVSSRAS